MKINELMCGDLVLKDDKPIRIYGIMERMERVYDTMTNDISLKHIAPIPLTAEILEKNGFDVGTFCSVFKDEEGRIEIYIRRFELDITKGWYTEDEETFSLPPAYSVHQYQHALRLCGLTELADNFKIE